MNFLEVVRFEIDYRLRRPYTWILGGVFLAMAGLLAVAVLVGEAESAGDLHANAPSLVGMASALISMLGLVISAALFSEAALRDHETRMFALFATSPLTKTEYLAGRFAGTLLVNVLFVSIVPIMLMLLMRPPFVNGELLGPRSGSQRTLRADARAPRADARTLRASAGHLRDSRRTHRVSERDPAGVHADTSCVRAGSAGVRSDTRGARPDTGGARPDTGGARSDTGGAGSDTGGARSDTRGARSDTRGARSDARVSRAALEVSGRCLRAS